MKTLILILALVYLASAFHDIENISTEKQFDLFKKEYSRSYKSSQEEQLRFRIFSENLALAREMTQKSKGYTQYGVTQFSDLTTLEFYHLYLNKRPQSDPIDGEHLVFNYTKTVIPDFWDWRFNSTDGWDGRCISPVYNQGQCGSCWAFSATEQIESDYCLQGHSGGIAEHLSMQQIVDCDKTSDGCDGGWTQHAYQYVISAGGLDSYASYPYTARDGGCDVKRNDIRAKVRSWGYVGQHNEGVMRSHIISNGPLSVCVDASSWQFYSGGVIVNCGQSIDHCVQVTGYTANFQGKEAWIVRNSWGRSWGYDGYLYVEFGHNVCAISDEPTVVGTEPA